MRCPACGQPAKVTRRHCPDEQPRCTWRRCTHCAAVIDVRTRRFYRPPPRDPTPPAK